jgi:DNA-binding XRE family transcriptional regulator
MKQGLIERTLKDLSTSRPPRSRRDYSGSRLTERCHEARLTQQDLAALVEVSQQTVGFWEQGRRYPTLTHVAKVQAVLYEQVRSVRAREQALRRFMLPSSCSSPLVLCFQILLSLILPRFDRRGLC